MQASYDPNAVAAVLAQFPYHVDSLLAMNELYRSMGEAQVIRGCGQKLPLVSCCTSVRLRLRYSKV
jgi:hypothetical protein